LNLELDRRSAFHGESLIARIPEGTTQAPQQEHEIVMLLNFADELRRRVPLVR